MIIARGAGGMLRIRRISTRCENILRDSYSPAVCRPERNIILLRPGILARARG